MKKQEFAKRVAKLRQNKGVSARDMSLSLGQSENYINHIENGKAFPSMAVFSKFAIILVLHQVSFSLMTKRIPRP